MTGKQKPEDVLKREWITPSKWVFEHAECQKKIWELERSNASLEGKLDDVLSRFDCARGETVAATNRIKELKSQLASAQGKNEEQNTVLNNLHKRNEWLEGQLASAQGKNAERLSKLLEAKVKKAKPQEIADFVSEELLKQERREGELAGLKWVKETASRASPPDFDFCALSIDMCKQIEKRIAELEGKGENK